MGTLSIKPENLPFLLYSQDDPWHYHWHYAGTDLYLTKAIEVVCQIDEAMHGPF